MSDRKTQSARILAVLLQARGDWVPVLELARIALQYGVRIFELRKVGFRIENKTRVVNGVKHSWFRLVAGTAMRQVAKPHAPEDFYRPVRPVQQALFSDRHQDE